MSRRQKRNRRERPYSTPTPGVSATTQTPADQPISRRLSKKLLAIILSIASAFGVATIAVATNAYKKSIAPAVQDASCALSEIFNRNRAPHRYTVVVLPFANDGENKAQQTVGKALAEAYGLNVITSCSTIEVSVSGDRKKNIEMARDKAKALLERFDANTLVFGTIAGDGAGAPTKESRIIVTDQEYLPYLFDGSPSHEEQIDGAKLELYIRSGRIGTSAGFRDELIAEAHHLAESTGCLSPLFRSCGGRKLPMPTPNLVKVLQRLSQVQTVYINQHFYQYGNDLIRSNFAAISDIIAGIAVELYTNRGVKSLAVDGEKEEDLLHVAEMSEKYVDAFDGQGSAYSDNIRRSDVAIQLGVINLLQAETDCVPFVAEHAVEFFDQVEGEVRQLFDDIDSRPLTRLAAVTAARAKLVHYALSGRQEELWTSFVNAARFAKSGADVLPERLFVSAFILDRFETARKETLARIQSELALLDAAIREKDRGKVLERLGLGRCAKGGA